MKLLIVLIASTVLIVNKANCGVIGDVYDKVSNTTHDVTEDVYSWWSYGVDTVMGDDVKNSAAQCEENSWMIGRLYNKVKGGVSSGYMKVHDFVLGKESDPNKGIIRTLYERALKRLSDIKSSILGDNHVDKHVREIEDERQQVLKVLFSNRTDIFNTQNEKLALDSLRNKLTQTGDEVLHLADNERDVLRKAYESVRHKSDDLLKSAGETTDTVKNKFNENIQKTQEFVHQKSAGETADTVKNKFNDNIQKTQEFIQDESKKVNEAAQRVGEEVKKSASDIEA